MKNTKKEVLRNCIPAMVCMVISGLNTIIDGLFIGRNIGEDGLAAINMHGLCQRLSLRAV